MNEQPNVDTSRNCPLACYLSADEIPIFGTPTIRASTTTPAHLQILLDSYRELLMQECDIVNKALWSGKPEDVYTAFYRLRFRVKRAGWEERWKKRSEEAEKKETEKKEASNE
jgi:hypothetical protein